MKKAVLLLLLALAGVAGYWWYSNKSKGPADPQKELLPVAVSKYGNGFNAGLNSALQQYYTLAEKLVAWDSVGVTTAAAALQQAIAAVPWTALQKDTTIYATAQTALSSFETDFSILRSTQNFDIRRRSFQSLSQSLYDLLRTVQYDAGIVYLQECPMAFNDTETALWLSPQKAIRNPYLGLQHPRYKAGMVSCGETKDSLNYGPQNKRS